MNLTGSGALSGANIELVKSGVITPLQGAHDGVFMNDMSRLPDGAPRIFLAGTLYLMTVHGMEQELWQDECVTPQFSIAHVVKSHDQAPRIVDTVAMPMSETMQLCYELVESVPIQFSHAFVCESFEFGKQE